MSDILRILLFFAALATGGWICYKIRKLQVKMQDAIFWVVFAAILAVLGIFPEACYWLTERLGIISPANFIFLVIIFLLLEKVFTLSLVVSQLEEKISVLSAEVALRSSAAEKRLDQNEEILDDLAEKMQNRDGKNFKNPEEDHKDGEKEKSDRRRSE